MNDADATFDWVKTLWRLLWAPAYVVTGLIVVLIATVAYGPRFGREVLDALLEVW